MVEVAGNPKRLIIVFIEMDVILEQKLAVNNLSARFSQNDKARLADAVRRIRHQIRSKLARIQ